MHSSRVTILFIAFHSIHSSTSSFAVISKMTMEPKSTEWDVTLTLFDHSWKDHADVMTERVRTAPDTGVVFKALFQVEQGVRYDHGFAVRNEEATYHMHACLITEEPISKKEVYAHFGCSEKSILKRRWCTPRDRKHTYTGWMMHHAKSRSKVEDTDSAEPRYIYGLCPKDDENHRNAVLIHGMAKKWGFQDVQDHWYIVRERTRPSRTRMEKTEGELAQLRVKKREYDRTYRQKESSRVKRIERDNTRNFESMMSVIQQGNAILQLTSPSQDEKMTLVQLRERYRRFKDKSIYIGGLRRWCEDHGKEYPTWEVDAQD